MRSFLSFLFDVLKIVVIAMIVVLPIRMFVFQPFLVRGASMEPNFHNGDYLIVDQLSYRFRNPERGEVIVLKFPNDLSQRYIKRIVGLPGETIEVKDGRVVIYQDEENPQDVFVLDESAYLPLALQTPGSVKAELEENEYFVLGDNRPFSSDSRVWGILSREHIVGKSLLRIFSLDAIIKPLQALLGR